MAALQGIGVRADPTLSHNFLISLIEHDVTGAALALQVAKTVAFDIALGGFSECSGLGMTLQTEDVQEGGQNGYVHKLPTRTTWDTLMLKKGVGTGTDLWDWHYGFVEGKGVRRDGIVTLLNDLRVPTHIWYFRRGLPVRYLGPSLQAAQSAVAIEQVEIAHEGIWQVPAVGYATAAAGLAVNLAATPDTPFTD